MNSVLPPQPPPPAPGGAGSATGQVTVSPDQAELAKTLPQGVPVEAVAQARAVKNSVTLQIPGGSLEVKAPPGQTLPPIPEGASVLLQVAQGSNPPQLQILAINNRPLPGLMVPGMPGAPIPGLPRPGQALAGGMAGPLLDAIKNAAQPLNQPGSVPVGTGGATPPPQGMTATLVHADQPGAPHWGTDFAQMPTGTRLTVRITALGPDLPSQPAPPASLSAPSGPLPATPQSAAGQGPGQAIPSPGPDKGAAASPSVTTALSQPSTALAPSQSPSVPRANPILMGQVQAHPPQGQALIKTELGTLALPLSDPLPLGSRVQLEVVDRPLPPLPPATLPASSTPRGVTPDGWANGADALKVLADAKDAQALDQMMRLLPQTGPRLAAGMAMLGGALRNGEARGLMTDGLGKSLSKAGRGDLADALKADLEELDADAAKPLANGEWRMLMLPVMHGDRVDPVKLYIRSGSTEADGKGRATGTSNEQRFVLDFNLSQMGRLQMDGLVKRQEKLFDLIIRTDKPLPDDVRRAILGIFTNSSEVVGTKGAVGFQSGGRWQEFPPLPPEPMRVEA